MFNLINMNGRVYDSEIARFVSPDPIIQDPYNIISYNRYAYCLNNPLKYTDPSGYSSRRLWEEEMQRMEAYGQGAQFFNNYSENWTAYQQFHSIHNGLENYKYDWDKGVYVNVKGKEVSFDEVYNNYVQPQSQGNFDIDKALNYLKSNLNPPYGSGQCSPNMHAALIEGGLVSLKGVPVQAARKYGPLLLELGFNKVDPTGYNPQRGDIIVFQGYPGGRSNNEGVPYGHIQMYDGNNWISDFIQTRPLYPGQGYQDNKASYEIYKWSGH
jgi:hypothetical protein